MARILFFTREHSLDWVQNATNLGFKNCEFIFEVYDSLPHLKEIFIEKIQHVDGVLFSGQIPYAYIKNHYPNMNIPMLLFDITAADFYRVLSELLYKNKDLKMSRCSIDFIYSENNYLGIQEWIQEDDFPQRFSDSVKVYALDDVYDNIRDHHLKVWNEGKVDICMTRLTNLPELLAPFGIEPIVINPSAASMVEKIEALLKEIQFQQLIQNQVVIAHLELVLNRDNVIDLEYRQMSLHKAILDFSKKNKMSFIIHRNVLYYEIVTNYSDFNVITNDMKNCELVSFLTKELEFPVNIGWGIGHSMQEAQQSAKKAALMCDTSETQTYVMTKDGDLIGPLGDSDCINVSTEYNSIIDELSAKLHTSSLQIQKIKAVMDKLQKNMLTSEELSSHLGITERAANRVLKKLEEQGAASVTTQMQKKLRGRPKKVYHIHFEDVLNLTDTNSPIENTEISK